MDGGEGANQAPAMQSEMGRSRSLSWEMPVGPMLREERPLPSTRGHSCPSSRVHRGASPFSSALELVTAGG